jgi:hypothetical protein
VSEPVIVEHDETEDDGQQVFLDMGRDRERDQDLEQEPTSEPWRPEPGNVAEPEVVEGDVLQELDAPQPVVDGQSEPVEPRTSTRRRKPRSAPRAQGSRKTADAPAAPRARKTSAAPRSRTPRGRTRKESE